MNNCHIPKCDALISAKATLLSIISTFVLYAPLATAVPGELEIEALVQQKLSEMSIEEKVGQMTQITLGVILDRNARETTTIDPDKLREAIQTYHVGSILNSAQRAPSLQEWHGVIKSIQDEALQDDPEIPVIYGIDSIHGATYIKDATLFPHNIGLAAARNPGLVTQAAKITAMETRASGIRWNFDPVLGVGRNPLWSRFEETFGEDTYLTTTLGASVISAYEEDGLDSVTSVASCMKHYVGYSNPLTGKDRTPAYIPDIVLWQDYLPPFQAAVEAGSSTIMLNSASINGMPLHADKRLLTDVLREQFGFEGLVLSDWEDIIRLHTRHNIAETPRQAVKMAIDAGIDMSMVPNDFSFAKILTDLVKSGEVTEARIDRSVAIILTLKYELGLFDNPYHEEAAVENFGDPAYQQIALDAARESIVLLKNDSDILPLADSSKILLAGPAANNIGALHGSWSFSWQGDAEGNYPDSTQSLLQAMAHRFGSENLSSMAYDEYDDPRNYDRDSLADMAESADLIVLALGEKAYAESPGSIDDLTLPRNQLDLAKAAIATGKPVVIVLLEGRPRILEEIVPGAAAILQAHRPGSQGAIAITDILTGDYNPDAVLPYSYPRFTGDIETYDHGVLSNSRQRSVDDVRIDAHYPQWPFGFGLSYTSFEYSNLTLSNATLSGNDKMNISVVVTNTGDRDGKHAVDLFVRDMYASLSPAGRKLKRFDKVFIEKGAAVTVEFTLNKNDLTFVNSSLQSVVEPGTFKVMVDDLEAEFNYE